ncbi:MAG: hypothetical protein WD928_18200 [Gammaproteobacteria bacterium]
MSEIINLPPDHISKPDARALESFGGHTIAHGRATRWRWGRDADGNDVFELYRGGTQEMLAAWVERDHKADAWWARDAAGAPLASGTLDHVLAELDARLARSHGDDLPPVS